MASYAEIVAELINILKNDGSADVRAGAATGLGAAGSEEALHALREAMKNDPAGSVRGSAAKAVGLIIGRGN